MPLYSRTKIKINSDDLNLSPSSLCQPKVYTPNKPYFNYRVTASKPITGSKINRLYFDEEDDPKNDDKIFEAYEKKKMTPLQIDDTMLNKFTIPYFTQEIEKDQSQIINEEQSSDEEIGDIDQGNNISHGLLSKKPTNIEIKPIQHDSLGISSGESFSLSENKSNRPSINFTQENQFQESIIMNKLDEDNFNKGIENENQINEKIPKTVLNEDHIPKIIITEDVEEPIGRKIKLCNEKHDKLIQLFDVNERKAYCLDCGSKIRRRK